jgi:hypothetical protein
MPPNGPPSPPNAYAAARWDQGYVYVSHSQFSEPGDAQSYVDALNAQGDGSWFAAVWNREAQEWQAV